MPRFTSQQINLRLSDLDFQRAFQALTLNINSSVEVEIHSIRNERFRQRENACTSNYMQKCMLSIAYYNCMLKMRLLGVYNNNGKI